MVHPPRCKFSHKKLIDIWPNKQDLNFDRISISFFCVILKGEFAVMLSRRMLVIEKLVITVPDDVQSADGRDELSIDDILAWYLQYRKTQEAAIENQAGNFKYFYTNMPSGMIPDLPDSMDTGKLTGYLLDREDWKSAGCMAALILDMDLGEYRNCYTEAEMKTFERKKKIIMDQRESSIFPARLYNCDGCDEICSERCPDEPAVEEKMREDSADEV